MRLVFIHGRSQGGKDPKVLQATWEAAFDRGLAAAGRSRPANLTISFPFYGDDLDRMVTELDSPLVADVTERGAARDDKEMQFRGELLEEVARGAGVTEAQIEAEYKGDATQERGVQNWGWVHAILKALDRSKKAGELALDRFTRDVYLYLTNAAVRTRIDDLVAPHVAAGPCVVVGHSLGSIVAYNVLRAAGQRVPRYVTVGSPLGLNAVRNRLELVEMPRSTQSWHNARDPDDVVALRPLTSPSFAVNPPIVNYDRVDNGTDNQHGIVGYLPDPWVARSIHAALVGQTS